MSALRCEVGMDADAEKGARARRHGVPQKTWLAVLKAGVMLVRNMGVSTDGDGLMKLLACMSLQFFCVCKSLYAQNGRSNNPRSRYSC